MPSHKAPPPPPEQPSLSSYRRLIRDLSALERRFVLLLLQGVPHDDAAQKAGIKRCAQVPFPSMELLGRPRVERAISGLAPLLPDEALAVRILRPYLRRKLMADASRKGPGISAIRDLVHMGVTAPPAPGSAPAEAPGLRAWQERQAARKLQGG